MHRIIILQIVQVLITISLLASTKESKIAAVEAGWGINPASRVCWIVKRRASKRKHRTKALKIRQYGQYLVRSWWIGLLRSLTLWGLWQASGQIGPGWLLLLLPWLIWLLPPHAGRWGQVRQGLWQVQRAIIIGYAGIGMYHWLQTIFFKGGLSVGGMVLGCVVCGEDRPYVAVERIEEGGWKASLCGHFTLQVGEDHPFRLRLLLIFLELLQSDNDQRKSRRTRDGRTPFVRQEQLAAWTNTKQEHISRWMQYWLKGDWANLLSLKTAEVLTAELVERIVTICATFPHWTMAEVYQHLHQQGLKVSLAQVEQACQESGWTPLQIRLKACCDLKAGLHLRDEWLVEQLLRQIQMLLMKVEAVGGLTPEERWTLNDLQALSTQAGISVASPFPAQPWLQAMEGVLLGTWEQANDTTVHCLYCGSSDVAPKSKKPRQKKFKDAQGQLQTVQVYRYYCHNPHCSRKSFTHLPAGLLPYSPYRTQVHLLAVQMYAWGYSTYRRTGTALGVYSMTAYRWVSALGHDLLPVAALFGLVKSSGVVGVDEKYVLVPKNDKSATDMRRWMYVYLAVDVWTYDLLHIAIYPYNNEDSAKTFLLALWAKGYHPQVIVTDLRQDYDPVIKQVFPDAIHHECIFHALQNAHKHIRDVFGPHFADQHPQAQLLKLKIDAIFDTRLPSEAFARYQEVLSLKKSYVEATPASLSIFDFLERHWPKLVNAIGSDTIPTTNNVTELVIRRFDQHYQNFCGFESITSAQSYLAVFEKLYRFTPFSQDAQPRIRAKSPLQLAGYDVSQIPLSVICSGLSIDWPTEFCLVPN